MEFDILSGAETVDSLQEDFDESKVAVAKKVVSLRENIRLRRAAESMNPEAYPEAMRTTELSEVQLVLTVLVTILLKHAQGGWTMSTQLNGGQRERLRGLLENYKDAWDFPIRRWPLGIRACGWPGGERRGAQHGKGAGTPGGARGRLQSGFSLTFT